MSRGFLYAFLRIISYKCYYFFSFENLICHEFGHGKIPGSKIPDKTSKVAMRAAELDGYMRMIAKCCKEADESIWTYIFEGVTCGVSYGVLVTRGIPCGKDYYYDKYRKFFWLLDKVR